MDGSMTLITEECGDIANVDAESMDGMLASDAFGKFVILSASETDFIQAGNEWRSDVVTEAFLKTYDSDPWVLEYREGSLQFRAKGHVTLEQVRQAFKSYLTGASEWRGSLDWSVNAKYDQLQE